MKVLFAVSNENISESIVKKYQKEYKEIISYKNVYYFNAILKEIQKDKSYDRIVISEDLEPFANNNYDAIDKFLFEKLDSISDEATSSDSSDTPIILICTDRRSKSEDLLVKLFGIGVYNAIIGQDRSIDEICKLVRRPRNKKEAKVYYKIDSDNVNYQSGNENDVNEAEIQNILSHYKRLGRNETAYVKSFDEIASQYNDVQLKLIASFLPLNVKAVLEASSPSYQQLMTKPGGVLGRTNAQINKGKQNKEEGIKVNYLDSNKERTTLAKPVIIPEAMHTNQVRKLGRKKPEVENTQAASVLPGLEEEVETVLNRPVVRQQEPRRIQPQELEVEPLVMDEEETPKRRGRPRKNPLPEEQEVQSATPKRRGRPRKNPLPEEQVIETNPINEVEPVNLFGLDEEEETPVTPTNPLGQLMEEEPITSSMNATLPGLDFDEEDGEVKGNWEPQPMNNIMNMDMSREPEVSKDSNQGGQDYTNRFSSYDKVDTNDITNLKNDYTTGNLDVLLTGDKKLITFIGTSKNGTSFLVNNLAESLSASGIDVAILDTTQNRNTYYIYTKNEEELRKIAYDSISKLATGMAQGIKVNKNLSVYTALPGEDVGIEEYESILATLVQNHSLVLIDADFSTNLGYFAQSQEIYLVQSMDVLTIQPLTAFLRELKAKNILDPEKLRIVINKDTRVRSLTAKTIIGGLSYYNDPAMSFMTELFDREKIKYCTIPFEEQTYAKYLEGLVNCRISLSGYSKDFLNALKELSNMVYPLIGSKQTYQPNQNTNQYGSKFSTGMNNTLEQMKRNY